MSLPAVDAQPTLFGSIAAVAGDLFAEDDRYRLFARKVWPVLAGTRLELEKCYCSDNGRPGIEPVVLLGVLIFQFLERLPDRQALEMVKYHLGWKLALNLELEEKAFHPTVLVYFRQRLLAHGQSMVAFGAIVEALVQEGLIPKKTRQRLDSTHVVGVVARLSALDRTRETLRLALEELAEALPAGERPPHWPLLWERYVENKLGLQEQRGALKRQTKSGRRGYFFAPGMARTSAGGSARRTAGGAVEESLRGKLCAERERRPGSESAGEWGGTKSA